MQFRVADQRGFGRIGRKVCAATSAEFVVWGYCLPPYLYFFRHQRSLALS